MSTSTGIDSKVVWSTVLRPARRAKSGLSMALIAAVTSHLRHAVYLQAMEFLEMKVALLQRTDLFRYTPRQVVVEEQ